MSGQAPMVVMLVVWLGVTAYHAAHGERALCTLAALVSIAIALALVTG